MCCGPCSLYPLKELYQSEFNVIGYFHNPNIHPEEEFNKRVESVRKLASLMEQEVIIDDSYDVAPFFDGIKGTNKKEVPKEERCAHCYAIRFDKTAEKALEIGADAFTSSLLYSRYQDHEQILGAAEEASKNFGVEFFYEDFRPGWGEGIGLSREMGLYRQKYCGCVFSYIERNLHKKKGVSGKPTNKDI